MSDGDNYAETLNRLNRAMGKLGGEGTLLCFYMEEQVQASFTFFFYYIKAKFIV